MKLRTNLMMLPAHTKFVRTAVMYNLVIFTIFLLTYSLMDFTKHFKCNQPVTAHTKLYFAIITHSNGGPSDITPITDTGRLVMGLHVTLAWMQLVLVFLS